MKEIETNQNREPIPAIFAESFPNGFGSPMETEIDQIAGKINRAFIARRLNWRDRIQMMSG